MSKNGTTTNSIDPCMTVQEVAKFLRIERSTVYRLVYARELPAFRLGGAWRFKLSELNKYISRNTIVVR